MDTSKISKRERDHLRAFLTYASGNLSQATEEWISILVDHPLGELGMCIYRAYEPLKATECITSMDIN